MNRIVLVTGGGTGIGAEVVKKFCQEGMRVVATYNRSPPAYNHTNVLFKQLDITNKLACSDFIEELVSLELEPEILINNAGIVKDVMFHKMTYDTWMDVINVNLLSIYNLTQPIFSAMRSRGYGRIINISSVNANKGQLGQVNYCSAKAGIQGFTKALALEGARYGVTVNSVSPGYSDTGMVSGIKTEILDTIVDTIPMKRLARPEEIAELVFYLTRDVAGYITGSNYEINGGLYFS